MPLGFPLDLEPGGGVLRGIRLPLMHKPLNLQETKRHKQISCSVGHTVIESIAQMVCFSFAVHLINRNLNIRFLVSSCRLYMRAARCKVKLQNNPTGSDSPQRPQNILNLFGVLCVLCGRFCHSRIQFV